MKRIPLLLVCLLVVGSAVGAETKKRPMTLDDLFKCKRVSDPQISPDGKLVVYAIGIPDMETNSIPTTLWLAPTDPKQGKPRQLTNTTKKDKHPRWSPDGKQILFESTRSGDSQLWVIDVAGGEAKQLTTISTEASTGIWSSDGKSIAFVSTVWPEFSAKPYKESNEANKKKKEEIEKSPVKAKTFTKLFFRHWDEWVEDKRKHLFVMSAAGGEPRDVTPGDRDAYPTSDTFSVGDDFTFSPDSKYLVYTAPPEKDEAWSTNYDIWRVATDGKGKPENLTKDNKAADSAPRFSPDGTKLAYRAQKKAGYESDRWDLMFVETDTSGTFKGKSKSWLAQFNTPKDALEKLSVNEFVWLSMSSNIAFIAEQEGKAHVFLSPYLHANITMLPDQPVGTLGSLSLSSAGETYAMTGSSFSQSADVFAVNMKLEKKEVSFLNLSKANNSLFSELELPKPESVTVKGAGDTPMQMWIIKPPGFDAKKKWPLVYLVHGGPQGAWLDEWHYRWNPQVWAAQGYVVAMPNPRGSTGFGQKYVDEISNDWGGKCYEDLMKGLEYLEKQPYIDKDRMAAAGASFGGYMMNWFAGHTDKFKTLITHCGVYNLETAYLLTDELWFDEWEHGGPPWLKREDYEKFSPHRFAKKMKTPMLIIHNDLDFRVPLAEGFQLFTTLQRQGVASKMINFPDEGHWVLKPKNSEHWHKEIFAWLKKYAPPGGK